jgi:hypothetical protein
MRVLVDLLEPGLVDVRVGVRLAVVLVLVDMLHVVVIVNRMWMDVGVAVVLVLVGVRCQVGVFLGHVAPVVVLIVDSRGALAAWSWR